MKRITSIGLFAGVFFLAACSSPQTEDKQATEPKEVEYLLSKTVGWLEGVWENANEHGAMREAWEVVNDSTMSALVTGITFNPPDADGNGDVTIDTLETVSLEERYGSIFYIPAVKDQNKGLPVKFRLTASSETELKFENPDHDFPQIITYRKINEDSMTATISGIWNAKPAEDFFPFKRVK